MSVEGLKCKECGAKYEESAAYFCENCFGPLEVSYDHSGLDAAEGDAAIPIDVDLQDPPEIIPEMVAKWRNGYDVVLARRVDRRQLHLQGVGRAGEAIDGNPRERGGGRQRPRR